MSVAPLRRLAVDHWPLLAVCAIFLSAAALSLNDYPIMWGDARSQRPLGNAALDYLAGDGERAFKQLYLPSDRYYGAAFEAPLALAERILALESERDVAFTRHLLTHLFFLAGGVFCYLLVCRLFSNRLLALLAMGLFLLHPRIYAHSFFNSKDVPFLAMFTLSLFLIHRAFRRDTLAAFLLCGAGVGLLVNLRIMGLILFAAVLALRTLDLLTAIGNAERKRVLLTGGAFALTAILTFHASMPVLWTDPIGRFAELVRMFASHPQQAFNLFQGQLLYAPDGPPLDYVPVWVGITTPPATLLLAVAGALALAWRGGRQPRDILRSGPLRFGLLLLALPVATVTAIVILESNVYSSWRQLYFLYAPLSLLAIFGLYWLISSTRGRWSRGGAYALAGVSVAVTVVSMARIHPHEAIHFNFLTDRTTPERLHDEYDLRYWQLPVHHVFGDTLNEHPSGNIFLSLGLNAQQRYQRMLSAADKKRLIFTDDFRSGQTNLHALEGPCPVALPLAAHVSRLYANTLSCVVDPVAWFGGLRQRALATEPLDRSRFDTHRVGDMLVYLRDGCPPDDGTHIFLHVFPVNPADLPDHSPDFPRYRRDHGFESRDFTFTRAGVRIDGDCIAVAPLPDYPITRIRTGQYTPAYADAVLRSLRNAEPLVRARFAIHLDPAERTLTYVRDGCSAEDAAARFFLHLLPHNASTLPEHRRAHSFDSLDFSLGEYGARTSDGRCLAVVPIPNYLISSIHTGQFDGRERLWTEEFAWPAGE